MIKVDKGEVAIQGSTADILSDLGVACKSIRKALEPSIGSEDTEMLIQRAVSLSRMSTDELMAERQKLQEGVIKLQEEVMKMIFGKRGI